MGPGHKPRRFSWEEVRENRRLDEDRRRMQELAKLWAETPAAVAAEEDADAAEEEAAREFRQESDAVTQLVEAIESGVFDVHITRLLQALRARWEETRDD